MQRFIGGLRRRSAAAAHIGKRKERGSRELMIKVTIPETLSSQHAHGGWLRRSIAFHAVVASFRTDGSREGGGVQGGF